MFKDKSRCVFKEDWKLEFNFIDKSSAGRDFFWCKYCRSDIKCANGGKVDVKKHTETQKHLKAARSITESKISTLKNFIAVPDEKASAAELAIVYHTVKHHHSYRSTDCLTSLTKQIFSDSKVVQSVTCGRTKSQALAHNVLAPASTEVLVNEIKSKKYFSLSSDASNKRSIKCFPLLLKFFDPKIGLKTCLLDFYEDSDESSEKVTEQVVSKLNLAEIDIGFMSSYSADNCSVNFGVHSGVHKRLKQLNPNILKANCLAHLLHNASHNAVNKLDYDVESFVLKVYAHFSRSAVRRQQLKEFFAFVDSEWVPLLKHVSTRFLSLLPALDRILLNWDALRSYFRSLEEETLPKLVVRFLNTNMDDDTHNVAKNYLYFSSHIMKVIHDTIEGLESSTITVTTVYAIMEELTAKFDSRIEQKFFGAQMSTFLKTLPVSERIKIEKNLIEFYSTFVKYVRKRYDFSENNFHKVVACMSLKSEFSYEELVAAAKSVKLEMNLDELFDEYTILQKFVKSELSDPTNISVVEKYVKFFSAVGTDCPELLKIVSFLLSVNCTNADAERVFSMMRQLWSDQRSNLNIEGVRAELQIIINFQKKECSEMYKYFLGNKSLLKASRSSQKYDWMKPKK